MLEGILHQRDGCWCSVGVLSYRCALSWVLQLNSLLFWISMVYFQFDFWVLGSSWDSDSWEALSSSHSLILCKCLTTCFSGEFEFLIDQILSPNTAVSLLRSQSSELEIYYPLRESARDLLMQYSNLRIDFAFLMAESFSSGIQSICASCALTSDLVSLSTSFSLSSRAGLGHQVSLSYTMAGCCAVRAQPHRLSAPRHHISYLWSIQSSVVVLLLSVFYFCSLLSVSADHSNNSNP